MVVDMSGKVPSTRRDVEWYALWMTHEYVQKTSAPPTW